MVVFLKFVYFKSIELMKVVKRYIGINSKLEKMQFLDEVFYVRG